MSDTADKPSAPTAADLSRLLEAARGDDRIKFWIRVTTDGLDRKAMAVALQPERQLLEGLWAQASLGLSRAREAVRSGREDQNTSDAYDAPLADLQWVFEHLIERATKGIDNAAVIAAYRPRGSVREEVTERDDRGRIKTVIRSGPQAKVESPEAG